MLVAHRVRTCFRTDYTRVRYFWDIFSRYYPILRTLVQFHAVYHQIIVVVKTL